MVSIKEFKSLRKGSKLSLVSNIASYNEPMRVTVTGKSSLKSFGTPIIFGRVGKAKQEYAFAIDRFNAKGVR